MDGAHGASKLITLAIVSLFILSGTAIVLQENFTGSDKSGSGDLYYPSQDDDDRESGRPGDRPDRTSPDEDRDIDDPGRKRSRAPEDRELDAERQRPGDRSSSDESDRLGPDPGNDHTSDSTVDYKQPMIRDRVKNDEDSGSSSIERPDRPEQSGTKVKPDNEIITPHYFNLDVFVAPKPLGVNVSDPITTQTWDTANSPYYINSNVTIPVGNTLYINPDVEVIFNGSYSIFVEGALYANGTAVDNINFTSNQTSPSAGDWGTIRFNSTGAGRIAYASINFSTNGIEINSSAGIEVANCNISYASIHGVMASKGGFNIHDNLFNTGMYSISVDIYYKNAGSTTVGTININDNEVEGAYGFKFNRLRFDTPVPASTITVNDVFITGNTVNSTTSTGIRMTNFGVWYMNGGSISWGDLVITNNYMNIAADYCIYFYNYFKNLTNVNANIGIINVSNNNLSTPDSCIHIHWWNFEELYGSTNVVAGDTTINDNFIGWSGGQAIKLAIDDFGMKMYNSSSVTAGDTIVKNNNILTGSSGIYFQFGETGYEMFGGSSVVWGDHFINNNIITSGGNGIDLEFSYCGYIMYDQSRADFGSFNIYSNRLTATVDGIYFNSYENGYYLYNNARVNFSDVTIDNNNIIAGGSGNWAIYHLLGTIGNYMFDNSQVAIGYQKIINNKITSSTGGIYSSPATIGYKNENNATVFFNDHLIQNNNITAGTNEGIYFTSSYCGYDNQDNTTVTVGNTSIIDNFASTTSKSGMYFTFFYNGNYLYENSMYTTGWIDVSNNNFSSVSSRGIGIKYYYLAQYLYATSSVVFGDISFTDNEVRSTSEIGINLLEYQQNGYLMYDNSSAIFGDTLLNDNTIVSADNGYNFGDLNYHGYYLYDNTTVIFGNFEVNRNKVTSYTAAGMHYSNIDYYGAQMYDHSYFIMGDLLMNNNTIRSSGSTIYFEPEYFGYEMYDNSSAVVGINEINDNYLNTTNSYGVYSWWWYDSGNDLYDNASFSMGDCRIINNTIRAYGSSYGIYTGPHNTGNDVYDNARAIFGDYLIMYNDVYAYTGNALHLDYHEVAYHVKPFNFATCTAVVTVGDYLINYNTIKTGDKDAINFAPNNNGKDIHGDAVITLGNVEINGNRIINAYWDGIDIDSQGLGLDLYDNAKVYFGHFEINDNNITISSGAEGIKIAQFSEVGYSMYNNSYFEMGNFEIYNNDVSTDSQASIDISAFNKWGYDMHGTSTAIIGDLIFSNNDIISTTSSGLNAPNDIKYFGAYLYDASSFTMGDWLANDNVIRANNQGLSLDFDFFGYEVYGNSSVVMGDCEVNNNYVNATTGAALIVYGRWYHGSNLYKNATVTGGDFFMMNNEIYGYSGDAFYAEMRNIGKNVYDNSSTVFGDHIFTNNEIYGEDGTSVFIYLDGIGHTMTTSYFNYCTSSVTVGDFLFNNNNVTLRNYGYGIDYGLSESARDLYGDASVTMGNFEVNNNNVDSPGDAIYFDFFTVGYNMYGNNTVTLGHIQINDNTLLSSNDYGIDAYDFQNIARNLQKSSSFRMQNYEICRNHITSPKDGIYTRDLADNAYSLSTNSRAVFGDFLYNGNNITTDGEGIYIMNFLNLGRFISGSSSARFGNFSFNNNVIKALLGDGISFNNFNSYGRSLTGSAMFVMGNWQVNNNKIWTKNVGIHFEPDSWGNNLYGETSAQFGYMELINNYINSTSSNGIYSWYWSYFGNYLYENSTVTVGDCRIMNNDVIVSGTLNAVATGASDAAVYVYDNSMVTLGDYIVSGNDITTNNSYGIYMTNGYMGHTMTTSLFSNCTSTVTIGDIKVNNNDVTSKYNEGIYFYIRTVGYNLNYWASFNIGNIEINGNTINSFDRTLFFDSYEIATQVYDNATISMGSTTLDGNTLTSTNEEGLYFRSRNSYKINQDSAFDAGNYKISNNVISGNSYGIFMKMEDCVSANERSQANIPGFQITGNTVNPVSISAFNFTTLNLPLNRDTGATVTWGYVVVSGNDFDGGNYGTAVTWTDPDPNAGQPLFILADNTIHDGPANSTGLFMLNINFSVIINVTINKFDFGVYVNNSNIQIMDNSTVSNIVLASYYFTQNSTVVTLNTTFNKANVYYKDYDSQLAVLWYMHVQVKDQMDAVVPDANLAVTNVDSFILFDGKTDSSGHVQFIKCVDYMENKTGLIKSFNDHNVSANDAGIFGYAEPTMDSTKWVTIILIDDILPTLIKDNSDTLASTGDLFTFRADITDNLGVDSVFVEYWFGSTHMIMSMGNVPYNFTAIIPWDSIDELHYTFNATDIVGNTLITGQVNVTVYDNDKPFSLLDDSEFKAVYGKKFNFYVEALDNIAVTSVHAVWWYDSALSVNDTMIGTNPYTWNVTIASSGVQTFHYYFTVTDAAGNWRIGPTVDINVTDSVSPLVEIISPAQDAVVGGTIEIRVNVTDENIGLDYVIVKVQNTDAYNGTPATMSFTVQFDTTALNDGFNSISAYAVDLAGNPGTDGVNINVDNTPPEVIAGPDRSIEEGTEFNFLGSASDAHLDVTSYSWSFTYDGKDHDFPGTEFNFTFDIMGSYTVTLTAADTLGNIGSDTVIINVTEKVIPEPRRPWVLITAPAEGAVDIPFDTTVTITFDIPMNDTITGSVLSITPTAEYTLSWNTDKTVLTITFTGNLSHNTTYTITIGDALATTGGLLQDAPFTLKFTTEKKIETPPVKNPSIAIGSPSLDLDFEPGETVTVTGTSTDMDEGTQVTVTVGDTTETTTVGADGSWSVTIALPDEEGSYQFTVTAGDESETKSFTITKPDEKEDEPSDDGLSQGMLFAIIGIIVLIIVALVVLMMRKKKPEEAMEEIEE